MRKVKLIAVLATALSLASCLGTDEPYTAGFVFIKPTANVTMLYANNTSDSIIFYSYGNWNLNTSAAMGGNWFSVAPTSGNGQVVYSLPVSFKQNTTGESRYGELRFTDTAHPGDANATLYFWQYATRGDGSLGNAADVKAISGTDGSHYEFSYDELHRPLSLKVSKDGTLLHSLSLSYNNADSILTVRDKEKTLTGRFTNDYQPIQLIGDGDTIGYTAQYNGVGYPVQPGMAFNLVHRSFNSVKAYAFLLGGQQLAPDSLHRADSLTIINKTKEFNVTERLKMYYSQADNRHQSVDANQIVFGAEQCDPYQLLSLFRYTRSTSIVSKIEHFGDQTYDVTVKLNADNSVAEMTVRQTQYWLGAPPSTTDITYTFEY